MYRTLFILFLFFVLAGSAQAYLDPGTGSFIIQMLIATTAGVAFTVKIYWGKLRRVKKVLFRRNSSNTEVKTEELKKDEGDDLTGQ